MKRLLMVCALLFAAISSGEAAMAKKIDKEALANKIRALAGLEAEECSELLGLLSEQKKYGLVWEDKPEDVEAAMREALPVLSEVKERAIVAPGTPNHILIEGENLHALTCLTYTHSNKVDVIYIDPPYNTGNKDFVYNDRYVDKEDAFRHSKWLSFMAKRLRIAKGLLSDRGVIFISIDDNEQAQLKLLCDEIFGEENFTGQIILKTATDNNVSQINTEHEYMLCYCNRKLIQGNWKRTSAAARKIIEKYQELKSRIEEPSDIQKELRKWIKANKEQLPQVAHYNKVDQKGVYSSSSNSSNPHPGGYMYDIYHPVTKLPVPKPANGWRWPKSTFDSYDDDGEIVWGVNHTTQPHVKKRIETATDYLRTLIYEDNRGTTLELEQIFGGEKVFDNPKPTRVLTRILDFATQVDSTILDFFAGSGTTLHAVMKLNAEDGGKRTCILVTNNENGICEKVTYERNRRVIQGYTNANGEAVPGLTENSLRYYRTEFVPRRPSPRNARALMAASVDLLCVKNDLYKEAPRFFGKKLKKSAGRYFDDGRGKRMLVLFDEKTVPSVAAAIRDASFTGKVKIYVFAHGDYAYNEEFEEVADKVELCALPAAIRNAYRRVVGKYRPKKEDAQ